MQSIYKVFLMHFLIYSLEKNEFMKKLKLKMVSKLFNAHVLNYYIILVPDLEQPKIWWKGQVLHKHLENCTGNVIKY